MFLCNFDPLLLSLLVIVEISKYPIQSSINSLNQFYMCFFFVFISSDQCMCVSRVLCIFLGLEFWNPQISIFSRRVSTVSKFIRVVFGTSSNKNYVTNIVL